ncbi:zinc-ribbon and DUF3426 domain-containing protein [Marinomonas ostreistagni]|uniref:zinc-ribbon and DUF3426 domain-containing protein n=1 Tax=Marinomonas ostreistagni TaxID=359209 RepID=UPI001950CE81|nr:zinc-ribbon and DUF3426 domain-containing protein [Marinomonas ostreistagni]MBM6549657.1 zinc-ribbon domain-containing protein [Marinomonas ostreistagni]
MSDSMITRCPKCATTFRVTQEVLSMAKGKVRCGQCFHIFTAAAQPTETSTATKTARQATPQSQPTPSNPAPTYQYAEPESPPKREPKPAVETVTAPVQEDGSVNPDWLDTLFHEEDLAPYTPPEPATDPLSEDVNTNASTQASNPKQGTTNRNTQDQPARHNADELAPWEVELAELEDEFSRQAPEHEPVFSEQLKVEHPTQPSAAPSTTKPTRTSHASTSSHEPDYMQALHSLAHDISKQDQLSQDDYQSQESMKQLAAEYSLASLTDSDTPKRASKKTKYGWLWSLGSVAALLLLLIQIAIGFFDQGSRSPEFRGFYRAACSYLSCSLPAFEDISAIEIEHVRIQSHPTLPNTLQVNAIMTNTSQFAQPMPKLALEFYDLNRMPVAARLFAPQSYLHRDFLDITYMPPSTPIHVVIPIQDPGARAVTHQIKVFSNQTQSY